MDRAYWVLITHAASLPAIFIFLWSYKQRKDAESLFIFLKFIFCVTFSLFYHTRHVSDMAIDEHHRPLWALLDGYSSTSLIFSTTLYGLRVRPPHFYITANTVESVVLVLYLFDDMWFLTTWVLTLSCFVVLVMKWRTAYRYLLRFKCLSCCTLLSGIAAAGFFATARHSNYIFYHSLWHCCIFMTAAFGALLRFKLDSMLYPIHQRGQLDSI